MTNLESHKSTIENFIQKSIERFKSEHGTPNAIGIYCCPRAGWLTTNFNVDRTISETHNNCPDFQFVEFDFLELTELELENQNENPLFQIEGQTIIHNHDNGDEGLNEIVFNFLKPLMVDLKERNKTNVILQMLDSRFIEAV